MRSHHRELVFGEGSRLQQDRVGDRDLAEIVEDPALVQQRRVLVVQAVGGSDRLRVATDPLGVVDRVAIARFDGPREREEDALGGVEPGVEGAVLQQDLGANEELSRVERLVQEIVGAGLEPAQPDLAVARRGEEHDRDEPADRMRLQPAAHRDAVEPRHVDVEKDEVGFALGDGLERLDPVDGLPDLVPELVELRLEELAVRALVVDDQDEWAVRRNELLGHAAGLALATASRSAAGVIGLVR